VHKGKSQERKTRVGIRTLRSNLSGYIKRAHNGQFIEVTSRDEVVAELRPPVNIFNEVRRKPGTLKGRIRLAPDFDKLPADLIDAFES